MTKKIPLSTKNQYWFQVVLNLPIPSAFDYRSDELICTGLRVVVPFGRRTLIGVIISNLEYPFVNADRVRKIQMVLDDLPPFRTDWLRFMQFVADYYHHPLGQVILSVLPVSLRTVSFYIKQKKITTNRPLIIPDSKNKRYLISQSYESSDFVSLTSEQKQALNIIASLKSHKTVLLYGVTGSGKTEVYLQVIQKVLLSGSQVLIMVPEITLAPQLENRLRIRLESIFGSESIAIMHSGLKNSQRAESWSRIQLGTASIALGTRLSVFLPFKKLGLIIVDEEQDLSYKQRNGFRYSARDLAVWRAKDLDIPIVLGSATPSLESWFHSETGKYLRIELKSRAMVNRMPRIHLVNPNVNSFQQGFSPQLIHAIENRLKRKEQSLIFINRRGYAPVLRCTSCFWISDCPRCTTFTVLHRIRNINTLNCHHCGYVRPITKSCPKCGNQHLIPIGYGTQRIAEKLEEIFPNARIARIDSDTIRSSNSAQELFDLIHIGQIDILIGTQMLAKGHDFKKLTLIGIINADALLFTQDFRGPERLFTQLMQVSGRAGRHIEHSDVFVQTEHSNHVVYEALLAHNYEQFALEALHDRKITCLPPYIYQALLMAESKELSEAILFLKKAKILSKERSCLPSFGKNEIILHDPIPLRVMRLANIERAQILIEAVNRASLQKFLKKWIKNLRKVSSNTKIHWKLEVDPLEI